MTSERAYSDYLWDILEMIDKVEQFTRGMRLDEFVKDVKTQFAVVRAIEIIGEASNHPSPLTLDGPPLTRLHSRHREAPMEGYRSSDLGLRRV